MRVQTSIIKETIEIVDAAGNVIKEFPFVFNVSRSFQKAQDLRLEIAKTSEAGDLEALGRAVFDLFCAIFGDENAHGLDEHYNGDYMTMLNDLSPLIVDTIYPAIDNFVAKMVETRKRAKK